MDLRPTPQQAAFRDELRAWLRANLPEPWRGPLTTEAQKREALGRARAWQRKLFEGGWAGIAWPRAYGGRGAGPIEQAIFQEELVRAGAPPRVGVIGEGLVGPTIIQMGTEEQKRKYLPPMLTGDEIWCQGFSEPNAGSDLASLATRAELRDGAYVVNGQKTWTSFAHVADRCFLLARSDPAAPKHKGITCLLADMHAPGITVRPLRMMSGDSGFNEVFFTDVRVPVAERLGPPNAGWEVAMSALSHERANLGANFTVQFKESIDALARAARSRREDPLARQKIAQLVVELEVFRLNMLRAVSRLARTGAPGPEASILKLGWSELNQKVARAALEILGDTALLDGADGGRWVYNYLRCRGNTIEAGTSEIQRNIIAQRVLGLPKGA
jgi:alkylation response protein AidB-like acyl-CoA dehydrogenase